MKKHDENAKFVLWFSESPIVIDTYFLENSLVLGKGATTVHSRSPTWTPIIGDSVYHSSSSLRVPPTMHMSNNASHLLARAINRMPVGCANFEHLIIPRLIGTKRYTKKN